MHPTNAEPQTGFFSGNTKHPSCQTHLHKPHITLLARFNHIALQLHPTTTVEFSLEMQTHSFQQNMTQKSKYQRQRSSRWVTILKQYKWSRDHNIRQLIQYYPRVKWLFGKETDCMWADEEPSTWSNLITKQIISKYCNEWYAMDTKEELLIQRNLIAKQNASLYYSNECIPMGNRIDTYIYIIHS